VKHPTLETIACFHQGTLAQEERKRILDHAVNCSRCRLLLDGNQLVNVPGLYACSADIVDNMEEGEPEDILDYGGRHISYSWCEQYVQGTLSAAKQELVRSHCRECSLCITVLEDLKRLDLPLPSGQAKQAIGKKLSTEERATFDWRRSVRTVGPPAKPIRRHDTGVPFRAWVSLSLAGAALASVIVLTQHHVSHPSPSFHGSASVESRATEDVRLALSTGKLPIPDSIRRLSGHVSSSVRSSDSTPGIVSPSTSIVVFHLIGTPKVQVVSARPISPVATAVRSDRPMLKWNAVSPSSGYRISLAALQKQGSQETKTLEATVPGNVTAWQSPIPLDRDAAYSWTVTPLPPANHRHYTTLFVPTTSRFRTLSESDVALSAYAAQHYAASDPVRLGMVYARLGLLDDAGEQFHRYLDANPESPDREPIEKIFHDISSYTSPK
jgi:hypothetical protein